MKISKRASRKAADEYVLRLSDPDMSLEDADYLTTAEQIGHLRAGIDSLRGGGYADLRQYDSIGSFRNNLGHAIHDAPMPSLEKRMANIDQYGLKDRFIDDCMDSLYHYKSKIEQESAKNGEMFDIRQFDEDLVRLGLSACYDQDISVARDRVANKTHKKATDSDLTDDVRTGVRAIYPRFADKFGEYHGYNEFDCAIRMLEDKGALVKYEQEHGALPKDKDGNDYMFLHTREDGTAVPYSLNGYELHNTGVKEKWEPTCAFMTMKDGEPAADSFDLKTDYIKQHRYEQGYMTFVLDRAVDQGRIKPALSVSEPTASKPVPDASKTRDGIDIAPAEQTVTQDEFGL